MNKDRGIIKWQPFESLAPNKKIIENILYEKNKRKKPVLSLEQQMEIEEKLIEAFYEQEEITLKIYKNGYIQTITAKILSIDYTYKKIILSNKDKILFKQIIEVVNKSHKNFCVF